MSTGSMGVLRSWEENPFHRRVGDAVDDVQALHHVAEDAVAVGGGVLAFVVQRGIVGHVDKELGPGGVGTSGWRAKAIEPRTFFSPL